MKDVFYIMYLDGNNLNFSTITNSGSFGLSLGCWKAIRELYMYIEEL